ncbi:unnamed protein product [Lampetra fluviatilis]
MTPVFGPVTAGPIPGKHMDMLGQSLAGRQEKGQEGDEETAQLPEDADVSDDQASEAIAGAAFGPNGNIQYQFRTESCSGQEGGRG